MGNTTVDWGEQAIRARIDADIDRTLGDGARLGERIAKEEARVDTGRMRSATHATKVGKNVYILHNDVDYSIHNEFGRTADPGKPFIRVGYSAGKAFILTVFRRKYG